MSDRIGEFGIDQVLAKRLLTPGGRVAPTVAPELFPNLTVENDRPEWSYLKTEIRCGAQQTTIAAVAGQRSKLRVQNPVGSRTIAAFSRVRAQCTAQTVLRRLIGASPSLAAGNVPTVALDTRFPLTEFNSRLNITHGAEVGAAPSSRAFAVWVGGDTLFYDSPIILAPGGGFDVECVVDSTAIQSVWLVWYERPANPSELL